MEVAELVLVKCTRPNNLSIAVGSICDCKENRTAHHDSHRNKNLDLEEAEEAEEEDWGMPRGTTNSEAFRSLRGSTGCKESRTGQGNDHSTTAILHCS